MTISAIVPAFQAAGDLRVCLAALNASTAPPREIIVVDDGSADGTAEVARTAHARCVRQEDGPRGPGAARNRGAREARGDVLLFVDADVAVHPDTLARVRDYFARNPDLAALFGPYDDQPAHPGIVSRYRNLLHHYVHQQSSREASTFWGGCGAIRRDVYLQSGGFDERYRRPSIEDIEFGARLRAAGRRIWLCPDVLGCHMKRWTLGAVIRTDILHRAIPWSRLILTERRIPDDLNTRLSSRLSAVLAWLAVLAVAGTFVRAWLVWVAAGGLIMIGVLNARLYAFFARKGGVRFLIAAIALHVLYLLYSSATFGAVAIAVRARAALEAISRVRHRLRPRTESSVRVK